MLMLDIKQQNLIMQLYLKQKINQFKKKHTSNVEQLSKKTNWKIAERFLNQGSKKDHRE